MRPACGFRNRAWLATRFVERVEAAIGVGLKYPGVVSEMLLGMRQGEDQDRAAMDLCP